MTRTFYEVQIFGSKTKANLEHRYIHRLGYGQFLPVTSAELRAEMIVYNTYSLVVYRESWLTRAHALSLSLGEGPTFCEYIASCMTLERNQVPLALWRADLAIERHVTVSANWECHRC